jgi:sec-independent protein translocase protein TatB
MLRPMFGMGGTEILVILIVALLFLGPDKLPDAAKKISKGIRDIKKQSRALQQTIEDDENIGGALRDLRSALRGEDPPPPPKPRPPKQIEAPATPDPVGPAAALAAASDAPAASTETTATEVSAAPARDPHEHDAEVAASVFADSFESGHVSAPAAHAEHAEAPPAPKLTLPPTAGEPAETPASHAEADLAALVKPAPNTIARGAVASSTGGPDASSTGGSILEGTPAAAAEPSESKHG